MLQHMNISPPQLSCHTKSASCTEQAVLHQPHEFSADCKHNGLPEEKNQADADIVQPVTEDASDSVLLSHSCEPLEPSLKEVTQSWHIRLETPTEDLCKSIPRPEKMGIHQGHCLGSEVLPNGIGAAGAHGEQSRDIDLPASGILRNDTEETDVALSSCVVNEISRSLPEGVVNDSRAEYSPLQAEDMSKGGQAAEDSAPQQMSYGEILLVTPGGVCYNLSEAKENADFPPVNKPEQRGTLHDDLDRRPKSELSETTTKNGASNFSRSRGRIKRAVKSLAKLSRKKYALRSSTGSQKVLRSRNQEKIKPPESSGNPASASSTGDRKRKQRKKRRESTTSGDEYSKIRRHLRYLLNRMNYEQSLIIAYSAEGWKGLSLEKLKPEKELQRATSEIVRRKLKIRDLFQRIDSLCAEGRLPEALFDSEGEIDSEDIFCAKCQSKDVSLENDIILCDGACDRGFHQFCLVPPLLKEDIPPDDEGWLCPGCDCKVDCIDLLNDSQETKLSVTDSWEKVFPEAALAAEGGCIDQLPSDDSDDTSYDPDGPETDDEIQGDESSSDESDFTSTSEEMEPQPGAVQNLGLSSDDSEDNDYDPDAPDHDEIVKQESSSSDFSSDSEDLAAVIDDRRPSVEDDAAMSLGGPQRDCSGGKSCKLGKNLSMNDELTSILESDPPEDGSGPISARRKVESLDYKKLYDETYGNASSDSDDDEDFFESVRSSTRRKKEAEAAPSLANGSSPTLVEPNNRLAGSVPEDSSSNRAQSTPLTNTSTAPAESYCGNAKKTVGRKRKSDGQKPGPKTGSKPQETKSRGARTRRKK